MEEKPDKYLIVPIGQSARLPEITDSILRRNGGALSTERFFEELHRYVRTGVCKTVIPSQLPKLRELPERFFCYQIVRGIVRLNGREEF